MTTALVCELPTWSRLITRLVFVRFQPSRDSTVLFLPASYVFKYKLRHQTFLKKQIEALVFGFPIISCLYPNPPPRRPSNLLLKNAKFKLLWKTFLQPISLLWELILFSDVLFSDPFDVSQRIWFFSDRRLHYMLINMISMHSWCEGEHFHAAWKQAIVFHRSPALYFRSNSVVFISNVGFSNGDNCCQSRRIGKSIKRF